MVGPHPGQLGAARVAASALSMRTRSKMRKEGSKNELRRRDSVRLVTLPRQEVQQLHSPHHRQRCLMVFMLRSDSVVIDATTSVAEMKASIC